LFSHHVTLLDFKARPQRGWTALDVASLYDLARNCDTSPEGEAALHSSATRSLKQTRDPCFLHLSGLIFPNLPRLNLLTFDRSTSYLYPNRKMWFPYGPPFHSYRADALRWTLLVIPTQLQYRARQVFPRNEEPATRGEPLTRKVLLPNCPYLHCCLMLLPLLRPLIYSAPTEGGFDDSGLQRIYEAPSFFTASSFFEHALFLPAPLFRLQSNSRLYRPLTGRGHLFKTTACPVVQDPRPVLAWLRPTGLFTLLIV